MSHEGLRVVNFASPNTGAFPQAANITIPSGPGTAPKGAMFFTVSSTAFSNALAQTARISVGFSDATVDERCAMAFAENGAAAASADTAYRIDNTTVVQISGTSGGAILAEGNVTSYITDGATLSWSAPASAQGQAVFFFGTGVEVELREFTGSATVDTTASISGLSFAPNFVFVASIDKEFLPDDNGQGAMLSFGTAAKSSTTQSCSCIVWEDQASPTSVGCISRDDVCAVRLTSSGGTVTEGARLELTSWNSDGVTFTTRNASYALRCMVLCVYLPNRSGWAGAPVLPASTLGSFSRTDPNFTPAALLFYPAVVATAATLGSGRGSICLGLTDEFASGEVNATSRDNVATSDTGVGWGTALALRLINITSTSNIDWQATVTSFDTLGWTGSVGDAAPATRATAYLAISEIYQVQGDDTVDLQDVVVLRTDPVLVVSDAIDIQDTVVIPANGVAMTIVISDEVSISDLTAMTVTLATSDTVEIEDVLLKNGSGTIVTSDTESIDDMLGASLLGVLVTDADTVTITDTPAIGDQIRIQATARGAVLIGGADAGYVFSAGSERGTIGG